MKKGNLLKLFVVLIVSTIITCQVVPVMADEKFNTNLKNLKGVSGEWSEEAGGLRGVGMDGDIFAMSETEGTDFTYEATVKRNDGVAFSLVFRSNESGSEAYVANIDFDRNTARIFFFGNGGGDIGEPYEIPDPDKEEFKLRIEVIGSSMRYFVDGILAVSVSDDLYTKGYFGLLNYKSDCVYQDVIQKPITTANTPKLTSLEIKGISDAFTYKNETYDFNAKLPAGTDSINLIPKFENCEVTIGAYDASEKVLLQDTKVLSGAESPAISISNTKVTVVIKIKSEAVDITKTITITKEAAATEVPTATATVSAANTAATAAATAASSSQKAATAGTGDNDEPISTGVIIGIAAAVVLVGGIAAFMIIKKKK